MSFIQRELAKLGAALVAEPDGSNYERLYAAQQALAWAMEPEGFKTPFSAIMGIPAGSEDCSAHPRPPSS